MFMSTRYSNSKTSLQVFSKNDSLGKLCEFLTCEFSCSKLITCKYRNFRGAKIKFEERTRLNNAIWRAWHIQYKQKKKARFLQFAAPFSDESAHSTSQAVILEGKYWKRRLDKVHKTWRKHLEDKLLRSGGLSKEQLENDDVPDSCTDTEDESDVPSAQIKSADLRSNDSADSSHDSFKTLCAMYDFPDTLFSSCVDSQMDNMEANLFKDTSGMMQPTLVPLNPCFDSFMENFDFLFGDINSDSGTGSVGSVKNPPADMLLDNPTFSTVQPAQPVPIIGDDQYLQDSGGGLQRSFSDVTPPVFNNNGILSPCNFEDSSCFQPLPNIRLQTVLRGPLNNSNPAERYKQLPPQLEAPNLTAHLQAAMSTRPKLIHKSHSDSKLCKRNRKDVLPATAKKPRLNIKECNQSSSKSALKIEVTKGLKGNKSLPSFPSQYASSSVVSSQTISSIPPRTITSFSVMPSASLQAQSVVPFTSSVSEVCPISLSNPSASMQVTSTKTFASRSKIKHSFLPTNSLTATKSFSTHGTVAKIAPMRNNNHTVVSSPTSHVAISVTQAASSILASTITNSTSFASAPSQQIPLTSIGSTVSAQQPNATLPAVFNEQQLGSTLQSMQSTQSSETTMSYLQLLQQQLSLIMKQQEEQIAMQQEMKLQAERLRLLQQQPQEQQNQQQYQEQHQLHNYQQQTYVPEQGVIEERSYQQARQHQSPLVEVNVYQTQAPVSNSNVVTSQIHYPPQEINQPTRHIACKNTQDSLFANPTFVVASNISVKPSLTSTTAATNQNFRESKPIISNTISFKGKQMRKHSTPPSSPVFDKKEKSLVSKLYELEAPSSSSGKFEPLLEDHFFLKAPDVGEGPSAFQVVTPTSLDSALALVSLRHGSITPLANSAGDLKASLSEGISGYGNTSRVAEPLDIWKKTSDPNAQIGEQRRKVHLSAEQRRRGVIKNALEELNNLLPSNIDGKPTKLSNAAILDQTYHHILHMQEEHASLDLRIGQIQQEIDCVQDSINKCQNKLPLTGTNIPRQNTDYLLRSFFSFCKEMMKHSTKSWVFCLMMKPIFDSYNKLVSTKSVTEFTNSVWHWFERHCNLLILRPIVLETMTNLSVHTDLLNNPNSLDTAAKLALRNDDPTAFVKMHHVNH